MGIYLERLNQGKISDEISRDDLTGLMVDVWGINTPPLMSKPRDEAQARIDSYREAGLLQPSRVENIVIPARTIMPGVSIPPHTAPLYYFRKVDVAQAFERALDPATAAPGIMLWFEGIKEAGASSSQSLPQKAEAPNPAVFRKSKIVAAPWGLPTDAPSMKSILENPPDWVIRARTQKGLKGRGGGCTLGRGRTCQTTCRAERQEKMDCQTRVPDQHH